MSATWKNMIEITIFGESHGSAIGVVLGNLPSGVSLDFDAIEREMARRAPGGDTVSTKRKEKDKPEIMSGILNGVTTGAPLMALIKNEDSHSKDYSILKSHMRPSHSDFPAFIKYKGFNDVRGGGHFSGRITAPIVFAGAVAKQILMKKGIEIFAHISSVKDIEDDKFSVFINDDEKKALKAHKYPVLNCEVYEKMIKCIEDAAKEGDSVGGKVECMITGIPSGLGEPFFDSVESQMARLMFSVPAVKGINFGVENIDKLTGSKANDEYRYVGKEVQCTTNNNGGILGGITNGMPIVFSVSIKPTPSISKEQQTVDVEKNENSTLKIHGRHDPCIVPRAVSVIEAMAALCVLDLTRYNGEEI